MTELIPQKTAITYPGDLLGKENEPWGLYHMIGLEGGETREQVKQKTRELKAQYHPDRKHGDSTAFKTIQQVENILTDTGGELEEEHSQKAEYDEWSKLNEFFESSSETLEDITSQVLQKRKTQRRKAQMEQKLEEIDQRQGTNYYEQYQEIDQRNVESLEEKIENDIQKHTLLAEAFNTQIDIEELKDEVTNFYEEKRSQTQELMSDLQNKHSRQKYKDELWDITSYGNITFTKDRNPEVRLAEANYDGETIQATVAENNTFKLPQNVHCKVPEGDVTIEDPDLKGTIQVLDGDIKVKLDTGILDTKPIIKAKATEIETGHTYEHSHDDIYVPTGQEPTENPDIQLMTLNGTITLQEQNRLDTNTFSKGYNKKLGNNQNKIDKYLSNKKY